MKSPNSIDVYEFQLKIDEKLHELQKRNIHSKISKSSTKNKTKDLENKVTKLIKWNTITRQLQQLQKQTKPNKTEFKNVKPPSYNKDLLDTINRIMLVSLGRFKYLKF